MSGRQGFGSVAAATGTTGGSRPARFFDDYDDEYDDAYDEELLDEDEQHRGAMDADTRLCLLSDRILGKNFPIFF
jgi:hypothetical protein